MTWRGPHQRSGWYKLTQSCHWRTSAGKIRKWAANRSIFQEQTSYRSRTEILTVEFWKNVNLSAVNLAGTFTDPKNLSFHYAFAIHTASGFRLSMHSHKECTSICGPPPCVFIQSSLIFEFELCKPSGILREARFRKMNFDVYNRYFWHSITLSTKLCRMTTMRHLQHHLFTRKKQSPLQS